MKDNPKFWLEMLLAMLLFLGLTLVCGIVVFVLLALGVVQ